MNKKIAIIHFAYLPNIGGVEILIKEHALILKKLGHDVTVITGFGEADPDDSIPVIAVPELQSIFNLNPALQEKIKKGQVDSAEYLDLKNQIDRKLPNLLDPFDVLIVHNMLSIPHNLAFADSFLEYASHAENKRIIVYTHDHQYIYNGQLRDKKECVTSEKEDQILTTPLPNATYVAISETFAKPLAQILQLPRDRIHVVPNGLNINRFLNVDTGLGLMMREKGIYNRFPILLSPVNILQRKNIEYCLRTVAEMKKTYNDIYYIISGNPSHHRQTDPYYIQIQSLVQELELDEQVYFLHEIIDHALSISEMHTLYILSDAVLYLSSSENFGLPVIEAALTKTPIFVSDLEVFHEIGGEYLSYIDTQQKTPADAAKQIVSYLNTNRREQLNYHIRTQFDLKTIIQNKLIPLINQPAND